MKDTRYEIYVSVDIETDGPCPGLNNLLSIGSVAFDSRRGYDRSAIVGEFSANLELVDGARPDPDTMEWWSKPSQRAAWDAHRQSIEPADVVMKRYAQWLNDLPGPPIFVGHPAGFDFTFIYYYLHRFAQSNPFVRNAIDIETYAMALLGSPYLKASEKHWPEKWRDMSIVRTHVALDDALGQGIDFMRMMHIR